MKTILQLFAALVFYVLGAYSIKLAFSTLIPVDAAAIILVFGALCFICGLVVTVESFVLPENEDEQV